MYSDTIGSSSAWVAWRCGASFIFFLLIWILFVK
uniref:Uncharacterized protein n=1 Tax=Arundo donax TaxID=35708 RepID=A0A0A9AZL2_ARUDO